MKEMKTIRFKEDGDVYEIVDAEARDRIENVVVVSDETPGNHTDIWVKGEPEEIEFLTPNDLNSVVKTINYETPDANGNINIVDTNIGEGVDLFAREKLQTLKEDLASISNTGDVTEASGKFWGTTAEGAGWVPAPAGSGGGDGGMTWQTVQDVTLTEEVEAISIPFTEAYINGIPHAFRIMFIYVPSSTSAPSSAEFIIIAPKTEKGAWRDFKTCNVAGNSNSYAIATFIPIANWQMNGSTYFAMNSFVLSSLQTAVSSNTNGSGYNYIHRDAMSLTIKTKNNAPFGVNTRVIVEVLK